MYNRYCQHCPARRHHLGDICRFCKNPAQCSRADPKRRCDSCKFLFFQYNLFIYCEGAKLSFPIDDSRSRVQLHNFLNVAKDCVEVLEDLCEKYPPDVADVKEDYSDEC